LFGWLVGLFVCWFVYLFILNFFLGNFFTFFEVLEKKLEASFYFSVLQKNKMEKSCSFI